jgi:hypothetical protein
MNDLIIKCIPYKKLNLLIIECNNILYILKSWGLGIGDWGLGIGDWAQSPIPNPQSPTFY